jgi:hypothetical protein
MEAIKKIHKKSDLKNGAVQVATKINQNSSIIRDDGPVSKSFSFDN